MSRLSLAVVLSAGSLLAQANAVPGTDILMYELTDIGYQGRRGAAFPNGEAGFMVGHSWCNAGTVNLPWVSQSGGVMVDNYPRIAFLLARESGGRMVQVSGRSYCKHSPTPYNFSSGPCAPCTGGGGAFFYVGCSDTYGSGINSSQYALGPTDEIDPWLGTWNPQGSYFDRGDPPVGGAQAIDSIRSLTSAQISAFDAVKNRITVRESELLAGANYYAQCYAMAKTEPMAARNNNTTNRQVSITASGSSWSATASGISMNGSVLTRWQGAHNNIGNNYPDDGRFLVAVKVTGPTAGMYHYEYAIHNLDNNRGGASFRVPIAPGAGNMSIDEARAGAGALTVNVASEVPSGLPFANKYPVGTACGACQSAFYENFTTLQTFDLVGRSMTMTLNGGAYTIQELPASFVPASGTNLALGMSTQATVSLPFTLPYPGGTTTQLQVCSSGYVSPGIANPIQLVGSAATLLQGTARWAPAWSAWTTGPGPVNVFFDATPTRAILTWNAVACLAGTGTSTFQIQFYPDGTVRTLWQSIGSGPLPLLVGWAPGGGVTIPAGRDLSATLSTPFSLCPTSFDGLALDASAAPVLGTTLQWQLSGIAAGTGWGALLRSLTQATPPIDLTALGMPGCSAHVVDPVATVFLSPGSSVQFPETIPNVPALIALTLIGQAVTYNPPLTPLGLVASNGMVLSLGL